MRRGPQPVPAVSCWGTAEPIVLLLRSYLAQDWTHRDGSRDGDNSPSRNKGMEAGMETGLHTKRSGVLFPCRGK
jgi:hypothetical protein